MLSDSSRELQPHEGLQIKQDHKFFSRLMSKETSMANSSCRVYYGGASGAVPFTWESQPGTPKHPSSDITLPPLTPPPSYHSSLKSKSRQKKSMKPTLFSSIFPRLLSSPRKNHVSPSSSRSSTSSSSSLSSWSSLQGYSSSPPADSMNRKFHRRSLFSCSRTPTVHNCMDEDDEQGLGSQTSTLCFGAKPRNQNEFRGCKTVVNMKKTLLSIVSHGSGQRERFDEIGKKIKREADVSSHHQMGRRHMLGPPGTLNTITPCAACKLLRRRCAQECPFSPYFSPHEPQKFASVHRVFGASNVSKMLMEVPESQRADAANSLVYEANVRLRDPVYGCMGAISALQQQVQSLQAELNAVRADILKYKCREANFIPSSHVAFLSSGVVSVAAPPSAPTQLPPPPPPPLPPTSMSSMYTQPTTNADYSTISNDHNVSYFG